METEESKKSGRRTHNFGIMQWVTNLMNFQRGSASQVTELLSPNLMDYILILRVMELFFVSCTKRRLVVAFDYSKKMIELAKRRQSQYAKPN